MSIASWLRTPRIRRGLAASIVVLAAGGLVLFRADAQANPFGPPGGGGDATPLVAGANGSSFAGPGLHGTLSLSHSAVLAGNGQRLFADVRLVADGVTGDDKQRAPLAIAIVLDTSGSMSGEKIQQARDACTKLLADMRDDDEISFVRYSDTAELVQPLARVGSVRESLTARIRMLDASGGTAIPRGLAMGRSTLAEVTRGRVERIILVSDGLDNTRADAERLASDGFEHGITVSSLGIGLDFDESYMGSVARAGHGNFAFVQDGAALASFLNRELKETALTTVENATVRVQLPSGVRFVRATGADARADAAEVELKLGSMYSGEERRVLVELATSLDVGDTRGIEGEVAWSRVGGGAGEAHIPRIQVVASNDTSKVEGGRDGVVLARAVSVTASERELAATEAYAHGDVTTAQALIDENLKDLKAAEAYAPAPVATALDKQWKSYDSTKSAFGSAAPSSVAGKVHAKRAAVVNQDNAKSSAGF